MDLKQKIKELRDIILGKQDRLIAGDNIVIEKNTINAIIGAQDDSRWEQFIDYTVTDTEESNRILLLNCLDGNTIESKNFSEIVLHYKLLSVPEASSRYTRLCMSFNGGWNGGTWAEFKSNANGYDTMQRIAVVFKGFGGLGLAIIPDYNPRLWTGDNIISVGLSSEVIIPAGSTIKAWGRK